MKNVQGFRRGILPVLLPAALFAAGATAAPGTSARPPHARARASSAARSRSADASAFESDKGTFRILANGQPVGKESFEIAPSGANWTARGTTEIQSANGTTHVTGTLVLRPDGTPVHYDWAMQGAKKASASVDFSGAVATIELHAGNARPFTQQFTFPSARIAILDNNLYDQYAVLAHLYDWSKKGAQTFPVLVPQELTPGTATVESLGKQDADGKSLEELRVTTQDNEIDLYLDGSRLVRISVPSANAEIVRE
jgi:hypothetical protein